MRKLILLTALASVIGVTWAATADPSAPSTVTPHNHSMHSMGSGHDRMQGMGAGHDRMQGMMGGHEAGKSMGHGKGGMHGKDMMACDMSSHDAGKHDHRHATPEK